MSPAVIAKTQTVARKIVYGHAASNGEPPKENGRMGKGPFRLRAGSSSAPRHATPDDERRDAKVVPLRISAKTAANAVVRESTAGENIVRKNAVGDQELSFIPHRRHDCPNYDTCLGLAAALNWDSFSCRGCTGSVNTQLLWRAHAEIRGNHAMQELCRLPTLR